MAILRKMKLIGSSLLTSPGTSDDDTRIAEAVGGKIGNLVASGGK